MITMMNYGPPVSLKSLLLGQLLCNQQFNMLFFSFVPPAVLFLIAASMPTPAFVDTARHSESWHE